MPDASGFTQGYWQMGPTATVTVGHTIQISFRIRTSGFNVKDGSEAYFNIQNTPSPVFLGISSNVDGICQWRFVANSASIKFWLHNNDAGHGSVTVDIAQFSMVDLTTQGGSYTGTGTWTNAFLFPMPSPLSKE